MNALDTTCQVRMKNILFATDFSPAAEKALPYVVELARRYSSTVFTVHVKQPDVYPLATPAAWPKLAQEEEEFQRLSKQHLEEELQAIPHNLIFQVGDIWPVLSGVILEKGIDLLVLGTHGRRGFQKAVLGSVTETIFRQARCPVFTVGPAVSAKVRGTAELNRILYATDFSTESLAAAPYAISLAREHRAQLILLHLFQDHGPEEVAAFRHALADLVPFGADLRTEPDCIVERGAPGTKILEVAEGHGADLIVLGVRYPKRSLTPVTHFIHSDAYKIVAGATCPVLTVRG